MDNPVRYILPVRNYSWANLCVMIQSGIELYVYTAMVTKCNQNIRGDSKPEA